MSEIRCPMCGKPNPEELDVCQFCEARLKPLIGPFEPAETADASTPKRGGVTDWLDSLREQEEGSLLDSARGDVSEPETEEDVAHQAEDAYEDQPAEGAWLEDLRPGGEMDEEESESAAEDERLDWGTSEPSQTTGIPDWLSGLGKDIQGDEAKIPEFEIKSEQEGEASTASEEVETGEVEELEDIGATTAPQEEIEAFQQTFERDVLEESLVEDRKAEEPVGLEEETSAPIEIEEEEEIQADRAEEIPDWLAGFVEGEPVPMDESAETIEPEPLQMPDWLTELEDTTEQEISTEVHEGEPEHEPKAEDVLQEERADFEALQEPIAALEDEQLEVVAPFTFDEEDAALESGEMPDWLAGAPALDSVEEAPQPDETDAGLAPAELPGWLEAMRPVEAAAPSAPFSGDSEQSVETSGPLAGLRGVLPVEHEITQLKKLSSYAIKLQISDNQRRQASLFEELIAHEGESAPIEAGPAISSQSVLRVVIFLLLLLAVGWPIYTGSQNVALPEFSREIDQTSRLINSLAVGEPVLLAVDYEPGFSGEMDAASASIVDHLMIRGAYLAIVSSTPTGPAQAERLVQKVNRSAGHSYQDASQYSNLGYVPGGPAGLLGFAQAPRQVMPYGLNGDPVWDVAPLTNIQKLADFAYVVVITDSPETARAWIEQVQPTLADAEMIMVVSAQAEPLVRPYYEGYPQQVSGLITGLAGGAAYEGGMPRTILARNYWDAFSYGLILVVVLIVGGNTVNAVAGMLAGRKQTFRNKSK